MDMTHPHTSGNFERKFVKYLYFTSIDLPHRLGS